MAQFMTTDVLVYAALVFCVAGLPWAIMAYGLRSALSSGQLMEEEMPPRHAALMARYHETL